MKIRKQLCELLLSDIEAHPVWEFADDEEHVPGQDETTVRPYCGSSPVDSSQGTYFVLAKFTLADGAVMKGLLTPPTNEDGGLGKIQPVIITERGHVIFWQGVIRPSSSELRENYEILGRDAAQVFPIQVISDTEIIDGPIRATIPGFIVLENWETGKTRIVM